VTPILDVEDVQEALDALINGDHQGAADRFSQDVVLTGVGGCLRGRITGLPAVLDGFARMSRLTHGTYGTEVEAVYAGNTTPLVVVTRHWAVTNGEQVRGTQALIVTVAGGRIAALSTLSGPGSASGIWD
jgi:ketosteroid isomerase-like protein